ncbi:nucleoside monophosphate kinase [Candidatus Uhrbacteria bacterium]|nr:nucleoside monophosphate kinase [Candidatus Uhrbacteria bacterium]
MSDIYKIFLMGPQGSGKGTQSEKLSEYLGIPAFGMGQLLRDEVVTGSEFGNKLKNIMKLGDLVSDEDAAHVLKLRLERSDTKKGYILDGYPRNLAQYQAFNFDNPTHVFVIDISREESLKRLGGRLTCDHCGKVGSINDGLKSGDTDSCGGNWYQREDDTPEAISRRLDIYEHDTAPVIQKYAGYVTRIQGVGSIDTVFQRIIEALK